MIIDSHAHFEPRILQADDAVAKMDAAGVDRVALIPCMNDPVPKTPEKLLSLMRTLMRRKAGRLAAESIHRALLTKEGDLKLDGEIIRIYSRPSNKTVKEAIEAHPDRFLGWIFLNPRNNPNVVDELEKWRSVPGMIGVKLHPHWHDYRTHILTPLMRRIDELGLPVLIHLGFRKRGAFRHLAESFPGVNIIAAHAGFPFYDDLWSYGRGQRNLFVDLSSPYIDEELARAAVDVMGARKCLYGTDAPYGFHADDGSYDYHETRRWIDRMPITDAERDAVFGETFVELIGCLASSLRG